MFVIQLAQAANPLDRRLVTNMATNGVGRIGRIDDHAAGLDDFHRLFNQARLRILRVNLKKLTHDRSLFSS